jgi:hypothetical protein
MTLKLVVDNGPSKRPPKTKFSSFLSIVPASDLENVQLIKRYAEKVSLESDIATKLPNPNNPFSGNIDEKKVGKAIFALSPKRARELHDALLVIHYLSLNEDLARAAACRIDELNCSM